MYSLNEISNLSFSQNFFVIHYEWRLVLVKRLPLKILISFGLDCFGLWQILLNKNEINNKVYKWKVRLLENAYVKIFVRDYKSLHHHYYHFYYYYYYYYYYFQTDQSVTKQIKHTVDFRGGKLQQRPCIIMSIEPEPIQNTNRM